MKTNKVEALESYFKTDNEHWNSYALKTIRKALEKQLFSDFNKLMQLYESSINIASDTHREKPFEGLNLIIAEYDKNRFNALANWKLLVEPSKPVGPNWA